MGTPHPDKGKQYEHINERVKSCMETGIPAISIDCKKKEIVGNYKNGGAEWCEKGSPTLTFDHEFLWGGKAAPYGVYDMLEKEGFVKVGIGPDTAEFAVVVSEDNLAEDTLVDTGLDLAHLCLTDDALRDVADFLLVFLLDGRALAFCRRAVSSTG